MTPLVGGGGDVAAEEGVGDLERGEVDALSGVHVDVGGKGVLLQGLEHQAQSAGVLGGHSVVLSGVFTTTISRRKPS